MNEPRFNSGDTVKEIIPNEFPTGAELTVKGGGDTGYFLVQSGTDTRPGSSPQQSDFYSQRSRQSRAVKSFAMRRMDSSNRPQDA